MSAVPAHEEVPVASAPVRPSWPALALALTLPVATFGGPLAWWARPDPPAQLSPIAEAQEKLVAGDPDVVLLGASKVGTDLDQAAIAKAFAPNPDELKALNLSGTTAPVWYAVLKNRVYRTGKSPKLVIVYSTFDWTLASAPTGEAERAQLLAQLTEDEPVLRAKALGEGTGGATWDRVRRRRTELHTAMMGWLRNVSVGAILAPSSAEGTAEAGAELAGPALESLFGMQAGLDLTHTHRAIPIVEQERAVAKVSSRIEDTLIPDFLALAKEHGTKIVFVNAPVRQAVEASTDVDPQLMREAIQMLNEAGAGYLDMRQLRLGDTAFGDGTHLNRVGRDALTKALVERLDEIGAAGDGPIAAAKLPVIQRAPRVTRTGTPPALPAFNPVRGPRPCGYESPIPEFGSFNDFSLQLAGFGMVSPLLVLEDGEPLKAHATSGEFSEACKGAFLHEDRVVKFTPTGDTPEDLVRHTYTFALSDEAPLRTSSGFEAWWVYPGTTLALNFDDAPPAGAFGVVVDAVVFGAGNGEATLRVGDRQVSFAGTGLQRTASVAAPPPAGAWGLSVSSPPDGGWVLLRRMVVGNRDDARFIVGREGGASANTLAADAVYATPPNALPPLPAPREEGDIAAWDVSSFGVPDTDAMWKVTSVAGCSPLRLLEDGKALATPVVRVQDVKGPGRYTQVASTAYALGSDGTSPAKNGRAYSAVLDETRRCRGLRWLYPGDTVTLTVKPILVASLPGSPDLLEIGGAAVADSAAELRVRVRNGDTVHLDTTIPVASLASSPPRFPLAGASIAEPLVVELSTPPDAPYVLLSSLVLAHSGEVSFIAEAGR